MIHTSRTLLENRVNSPILYVINTMVWFNKLPDKTGADEFFAASYLQAPSECAAVIDGQAVPDVVVKVAGMTVEVQEPIAKADGLVL